MHTLKEKKKNFDQKTSKCILVGYYEESKSYQVQELQTKKVHITRDVIFNKGDKELDLGSLDIN